jgi:branched-chain amino acid transport system substrate-binding protein
MWQLRVSPGLARVTCVAMRHVEDQATREKVSMPGFTKSLLAAAAVITLSAGAARADIVIATAGPITGQYAVFGDQMKRGAEMAVKDINAKGGVLGQQLKLEVGDDACDPKQAVAVANQFVNKGVVFVAGHFCSGSSIPASQVYNEEGILQISPASTNPKLTEQGFDNVFRTCGRDDQQGTFAGNYVVDHHVGSKIAVLHDKTAYGKGLADEFKKQLNARGVKETMYEAITAGDKDFTALITKMKQAGIDVIYLGGYHTEAGLITRQAHEQGLNAQMISGDSLVTDEYWAITGDTGQGTLMTFSPDPRKNAVAQPVVAEFKAQGFDPEGYTLYTYAAIQAWAEAVAKAGSTDLTAVENALRSNQFETVLGPIGFDEKGDVKGAAYVMYEWKDGKYAEVSG